MTVMTPTQLKRRIRYLERRLKQTERERHALFATVVRLAMEDLYGKPKKKRTRK